MKPVVIENKIYEVRGQKVMLDFDLGELYATATKYLKELLGRTLKDSQWILCLKAPFWSGKV